MKAKNEVIVRKAAKEDEAAILDLAKRLFPNSHFAQKDGDVFLIATCGGVPAGFCHFRHRARSSFISGLGVLPPYRNHGLGTLLLSLALGLIDNHGSQTTFLKVRATNPASSIYVRFGFSEKRAGDTVLLERKNPN